MHDRIIFEGEFYSFMVEGLEVHDFVLIGPKQVLDFKAHHTILWIDLAQTSHHVS